MFRTTLTRPAWAAWAAASITVALATLPAMGHAQLAGNNMRGDFGVGSASQPAPHFYFSGFYSHYGTNTIRDADGEVRPNINTEIGVNALAAFVWWVTDKKVLGANYSIMAGGAFSNSALEAPGLDLERTTSFAFGDLYVQPVNLGWHTDRADYMAGVGLYMPTGRFEAGADDNIGLGMWGFELIAGSTVFLDADKRWSVAALAAYETHTKKKDTDVKVGDILTVEGGLGLNLFGGAGMIGAAYFGQWKMTKDDLGLDLGGLRKARSYGLGPEAMFVVPVGGKLIATVGLRYLWDLGVRNGTDGNTFMVMATFPLPSIPLQ